MQFKLTNRNSYVHFVARCSYYYHLGLTQTLLPCQPYDSLTHFCRSYPQHISNCSKINIPLSSNSHNNNINQLSPSKYKHCFQVFLKKLILHHNSSILDISLIHPNHNLLIHSSLSSKVPATTPLTALRSYKHYSQTNLLHRI